jgi:two-component system, OmpR family, alkaline phosphatase synthesis response regulator PhoP
MKKLILLIEDDAAISDVYTTALENIGHYEVKPLMDGQDVLKWMREDVKQGKSRKPDLILLDLILPDMNGLDLLKDLQEDVKDIPVFIMTNYSSEELKSIGLGLNSEKYLTKTNFSVQELVVMVDKRLKK